MNNFKEGQSQDQNQSNKAQSLDLSQVTNRKQLLDFANAAGYKTKGSQIPLDFYKKEINMVDFARALGYNYSDKTRNVSPGAFQRQRWFYMEKDQMKYPEAERKENASSQILISRRSEGPTSPNFKYNEHYYFSQNLTHSGERNKHGSIIDLVQLHFKADFKDSIKIIENFVFNNEELKKKALPFHLSGTSVSEGSEVRRLESYHNIRPLTDTSFLNSRGIDNETINHTNFKGSIHNAISENGQNVNTAFPIMGEKGLIGFEVRNHDFKSVIDYKNDGFYRSNVDHQSPVKQLTVMESAIDALSHQELRRLNNSLPGKDSQQVYLSTAGSVSTRQVELMQMMIDKGMSSRAMLLKEVPKENLKDVGRVTWQKDYNGKAVIGQDGKPIEIAHVHYNKPERLQLSFDNDPSGAMHTAKVLGKLKVSDYFKVSKKDDPLINLEIHPYMNKKTNVGRITWQINQPLELSNDAKLNVSASDKIAAHFESLNTTYKDKLSEGEPFQITKAKDPSTKSETVEIEFTNTSRQWNLAVDSIKELKFQNSQKVEILRPVLSDWNDDLKAVKGIDPILKRKYDIFSSVADFDASRKNTIESTTQQNQSTEHDSIEKQISKAMDKPHRIKI